jgi:uncharacterized protein (TIGR00288 family)
MDATGAEPRVAVLIDADNASHRRMKAVLDEVAKYGNPTIKRVYGDWSDDRLANWMPKLNTHGLRAMQQRAYTPGKNSTDLALVIDAMDLLYAGNVEAFALVTSDSDFTSLAVRLRESGKTVYAIGEGKTPLSLQNAVDVFIKLENLDDAEKPRATLTSPDSPKTPERPTSSALQSLLTRAVNAAAGTGQWASLASVGNHLHRLDPSFDTREHGYPKLAELVEQPYLETKPNGTQLLVKVRGPVKKAPAKKTVAKKA